MKIKTAKLYTLCSQIVDCPHQTPVWLNEGVFIVRNYNLINGRIDKKNASYVDETTYKKRIKRAIPESGDIIISREAPMGVVGIIPEGMKCCLGQRLVLLKVNKNECEAGYLLYMLQSYYVQSQIKQIDKTGSIVSNLNIPDLKNLDIPYMDLPKQKKLNVILSAIDSKMNNNNQILNEFEVMTKELYNYWFVQFDFPNERGKPYKSSGGKMLYNDVLKREIPSGWDVLSINNMASSCRGVTYNNNDLLPTPDDGVLVLRGNNIQNNNLVYDNNVAYIPENLISNDQHIKKYDILLTMSSGSKEHVGKCTMFQNDSPHTFGAFLSKFTPHSDKVYFVFQSMLTSYFKQKIKAICSGTGINNLTNQTFDDIYFAVPDSSTLSKFEEKANTFYELIGTNNLQNEELSRLRDELLPLLMNGQVKVTA
jgi:type I restriction enzyme S subunit